ncbi:unnamed protein product [Somion occarium]|uniref:Uncharacterized protein n=1 Tax=Somion occarium TaxID=3059160 RepID=A0ABP1D0Z7_9APHY
MHKGKQRQRNADDTASMMDASRPPETHAEPHLPIAAIAETSAAGPSSAGRGTVRCRDWADARRGSEGQSGAGTPQEERSRVDDGSPGSCREYLLHESSECAATSDGQSSRLPFSAPPSSTLPLPLYRATSLPSPNVPSSSFPTSSAQYSASPMSPDILLPLLRCPICRPTALLHNPITLRCGHTICSNHLTVPSSSSSSSLLASLLPSASKQPPQCPIPTCSSSSVLPQKLPVHPDAQVNVIPPPSTDHNSMRSSLDDDTLHSRSDVTINKIISLLIRSQADFSGPSLHLAAHGDDDERTDSEYSDAEGDDDDDDRRYTSDHDLDDRIHGRPHTSHYTSPPDHPPSASASRSRRRSLSRSPSPDRPRKRPRRSLHPDSCAYNHDHHRASASHQQDTHLGAGAQFEKELMAEVTCEICFALMWQPVTTPCQHTFCTKCLHRSLDHNPSCPLCRRPLPGYNYFQDHPCNKVILAIILKAFPEAYVSRGIAIEEEEHRAGLDTPVFVCQLSFPGMPVLLNFYEPRFRLMLRRCLETPHPRFGMIPPPRPAAPPPTSTSTSSRSSPSHEYGTMLEIRNVQMLADGQCRVEAWGSHRFRIMRKGELDGYVIAQVERVDDLEGAEEDEVVALDDLITGRRDDHDILGGSESLSGDAITEPLNSTSLRHRDGRHESVEGGSVGDSSGSRDGDLDENSATGQTSNSLPASRPRQQIQAPTNEELVRVCHEFLVQLREGTPWVVQQRISQMYVPMPEDPALFSFWMALLLPIDEHEKAKLLPIRSPRLRLRLIVHWIEQLNTQWWFSGGCVIS